MRALFRGEAASHGTWALVGALVLKVGNISLSLILARVLFPEEFGVYGAVLTTALVFSTVLVSPLAMAATRYIAAGSHSLHNSAQNSAIAAGRADGVVAVERLSVPAFIWHLVALGVGISALSATGLFFLAEPMAEGVFQAPMGPALRAAAGYVLFSGVYTMTTGVLNGLTEFRLTALMALADVSTGLPLAAVLGQQMGAPGALIGAGIGLAVGSAAGWLRATRRYQVARPALRERSGVRAALQDFAVPALLAGLVVAPANWVGTAMLVRFAGPEEMGFFQGASSLSSVLQFLPGVVASVALPHLAMSTRRAGSIGSGSENPTVTATMQWGMLSAFPPAIAFVGSAPWVVRLLLGPEFRASAEIILFQGPAMALAGIGAVAGQVFASHVRMWWAVGTNTVAGIIFIAMSVILIPKFGGLGLAGANLIEYAFHLCLVLVIRRYALGMQTTSAEAWTILAGLVGLGGSAYLAVRIGTAGSVAASLFIAAAYVVVWRRWMRA